MFARTIRLNAMLMLATSATVFYLGCGDDDDNATPSNRGGASGTTGGRGGNGGSSGKGGGATTGGTAGSGGSGDAGAATTGGTGQGGAPEGGSAGTPQGGGGAGGNTPEGGVGGASGGAGGAGGGTALPDCVAGELNADRCYADCTPTTSEEIMNRCSDGVDCTPFDNSTLTELGPNGELPTPIP